MLVKAAVRMMGSWFLELKRLHVPASSLVAFQAAAEADLCTLNYLQTQSNIIERFMSGAARQFEPQITRSGGVPSKFRFTVRCSECRKTNSYEASKPVPDAVVARHFNSTGWVLGRDRSFDLCPNCLRGPLTAPQDSGTREAQDRRPRGMADRSNEGAYPTAPGPHKIDEILARHLGKPAAAAEDVFRPKDVLRPSASTPEISRHSSPFPAPSPEVEQALTSMASDLKGLRAAVELMTEQLSKLVITGGQQVEVLARLAPLPMQLTDSLSNELRQIVDAAQTVSAPLTGAVEQKLARQEVLDPEPDARPDAEISSIPEIIPVPDERDAHEPRAAKRKARQPRQKTSGPVVVKSIADAKRSNRFYTTVRLSRELWNRSGFGPDDRVQIDWKGKTVSISRDPEGGVKPKSVGAATVVLQSWRLGDLNLDRVKVTSGTGSLRLTALS